MSDDLDAVLAELTELTQRVGAIEERLGCARCQAPPPPPARWPGDPTAKDRRPPHSAACPKAAWDR